MSVLKKCNDCCSPLNASTKSSNTVENTGLNTIANASCRFCNTATISRLLLNDAFSEEGGALPSMAKKDNASLVALEEIAESPLRCEQFQGTDPM